MRISDWSSDVCSSDLERYRPLVKREAISKQEYDAATARAAQAAADVESARAQADRAALDLNYARVTAPISGRAGRAQVTEGALVSASQDRKSTRLNSSN